MEYAQRFLEWLSYPSPAATSTLQDSSTSVHLPPPDFLSVVRHGRRHQSSPAAHTRSQPLTEFETQLREFVVHLYSDQSSSSAVLSRISESESDVDSGLTSERPLSSLSETQEAVPPHSHPLHPPWHLPTSPSPTPPPSLPPSLSHHTPSCSRHIMSGVRHNTTPLSPYSNRYQRPEPQTELPSFFSADDLIQVAPDPSLPPLGEAADVYFHPSIHGVPSRKEAASSSLNSSQAPPFWVPPSADNFSSQPSLSSLPLYSHTEVPSSSSASSASRNVSSDFRSLVGKSFQLPPSTQKQIAAAPQTPPTRMLAMPTTALPLHLVQLPAKNSREKEKRDEEVLEEEEGGKEKDKNQREKVREEQEESGGKKDEEEAKEMREKEENREGEKERKHGSQKLEEKENKWGKKNEGREECKVREKKENVNKEEDINVSEDVKGNRGSGMPSGQQPLNKDTPLPKMDSAVAMPPVAMASGGPDAPSDDNGVAAVPLRTSSQFSSTGGGGSSRKSSRGSLHTTPSGGRITVESPLSPKDVRERLVAMTPQGVGEKGGLKPLLNFGLSTSGEMDGRGEVWQKQLQSHSNGDGGEVREGGEDVWMVEEKGGRGGVLGVGEGGLRSSEVEEFGRGGGGGVGGRDSENDGEHKEMGVASKPLKKEQPQDPSLAHLPGRSLEQQTVEEEEEKEEDSTALSLLDDIETSSVLSMEQLTESLQASPLQPLSLLPPFNRGFDREKTPTPSSDAALSHKLSLPPSPTHSLHKFPPNQTPLTTSPAPASLPCHLQMPEHVKPLPKPSLKPSLPFPPGFICGEASSLPQSSNSPHYWARPLPVPAPSSPSTILRIQALEEELATSKQSQAHLEGQLESVLEECQVMLSERAELQTKLARTEATLEKLKRAGEGREEREPDDSGTLQEVARLREELRLARQEQERERKRKRETMSKYDVAQERHGARQLQVELEEMGKRQTSQAVLMKDLRDELQERAAKLAEEKEAAEETRHQLLALKASYQALEGAKEWMHRQLQEALDAKVALQEELRGSKAATVASGIRQEQLARENAIFQKQISDLHRGLLQDKAKLVSELESIEADVLSREDSYVQLVAKRAQMEALAARRGQELEKMSASLATAQVERDELQSKEAEDREKESDLLRQLQKIQQAKEAAEGRLHQVGEELEGKMDDVQQLQRVKTSLQEKLRESEVALVNREGALQGMKDARDILKQELELVREAQGRVDRELEASKREVGRLETSLQTAEEKGRENEMAVESMSEVQERLEGEKRALAERLAESERELGEKARELATLESQSQDIMSQFQDMAGQFQSIASERSAVDGSLAEKDKIISNLTQQKEEAERAGEVLKEEQDTLQRRLAHLQQQKARMEAQLETSSLPDQEELQKAVRERAVLQTQLDTARLAHQQAMRKAQGELEAMKEESAAAQREAGRSRKQAEKAAQAREEAVSKLAEVRLQSKASAAEARSALEEARKEQQAAERNAASTAEEIEELQTEKEQLEVSASDLRDQLTQEVLHRAEVERASEMVGVKLKQNAEERERRLREQNQELSLEVERLRGRLAGISSTQQAIRTHTGELESAFAQRESSLAEVASDAERTLKEWERADRTLRAKVSSLEDDAASLQADLSETQELLEEERTRSAGLSEELSQTNTELSRLRHDHSLGEKRSPALEEKISRLSRAKESLQAELSGAKAQLVVAKTRAEVAERELTDARAKVEILQQNLSLSKQQRKQTREEVEEARTELRRAEERHEEEVEELRRLSEEGRESTALEGGRRPGVFDTSLSTIPGEEGTDYALYQASASPSAPSSTSSHTGQERARAHESYHHQHPPSSLPPASSTASTSFPPAPSSLSPAPSSLPAHSGLYRAQLQEIGLKIEQARKQGQESVEAKKASEISVLRDELGSKSRTISSLQSCLLSLKDDMGRLQHKMQAHSATVQASHYSTKQLESQLADLKRSSSLHPPSFLSDTH